jgi:putative spermidine/putrescine transport system permease protein
VPLVHGQLVRLVRHFKKKSYAGYLFGGPYIVYWFALFLLPLVLTGLVSVYTNVPGGTLVPAFTLSNYVTVLTSTAYLRVLALTIAVATVATIVAVVGSYPVAYAVTFPPWRHVRLIVPAVAVALLVGNLVRALGWFALLGPGTVAESVGTDVLGWPLMHSSVGLVVAVASVVMPVTVLVLVRSLRRVDELFVEAAYTLGSNPVQAFVYVTIPLSLPGVVSATVATFVLSMGAFAVAVFVGPSVPMLAPAVYASTVESNWPMAAALAVVVGAIALVAVFLHGQAMRALAVDGRDLR